MQSPRPSNRSCSGREFSCLAAFLISLVITVFPLATAHAQPVASCGTVIPPEAVDQLFEHAMHLKNLKMQRAGETYKIPIQHHIVRQSDGTGGFTLAELDNAMVEANAMYVQTNVELYEYNPVNFIDEDYFYFDCSSASQYDSLRRYDVEPNAINIYWVPDESGFPYCGISAFTFSTVQAIVMNNLCGGIGPSNSTLVHEIGHYFNLFHTHETAFGQECPSGSNCDIAGDLHCDTPADPDLYQQVSAPPDCAYTGSDAPPAECDATPYSPQTENLMSYSYKSCRDFYSQEQIDKFRLTLENDRPELAIQLGDLHYYPTSIGQLSVAVGNTADVQVEVENVGDAATSITSVSTLGGVVSITGPGSITLNPGETQLYIISYDASGLAAPCDLGEYNDTVVFTTTDVERPQLNMPVSIIVGFDAPSASGYSFGPDCLNFGVGNTPGINSLVDPVGELLFNASLLIGTVNGTDTTVYQDLYSQDEYLIIDGFSQSIDSVGRITQTLQFLSGDGRIFGDLTYSYGANTAGLDSCGIIQVDYTITNDCDTSMTIAAGLFGDFDIIGAPGNDAIVGPAEELVYVAEDVTNRYAGFTNLTPDSPTRGAVAISNPVSIYPTSQFEDNEAYRKMVNGYSADVLDTDVSALLSFGERALPAGGQSSFSAAILVSSTSEADLVSKAVQIQNFFSPPEYVCGDADGNGSVSISDAVYIVTYIFGGGPAPDPEEAGDVNCDGNVSISDPVYIINYIFGGGPAPCSGCP